MRVKFGNVTKDVPLLEVTPENYIVPNGEENTYHCRIEQKQFDQRSGRRVSKPRIQKFDAKMYPSIARNLRMQGYDIEVLYDPTEHNAAEEAKRQEFAGKTLKERMQMVAEKKAAERKALKEEILAELKAAGMLKAPSKGNNSKGGGKKAENGEKTENPEK